MEHKAKEKVTACDDLRYNKEEFNSFSCLCIDYSLCIGSLTYQTVKKKECLCYK